MVVSMVALSLIITWRWGKRLREGKPLGRDTTLLRHELLKSEIEKKYNLGAREAHDRASEVYDWYGQLIAETKSKGEVEGIL